MKSIPSSRKVDMFTRILRAALKPGQGDAYARTVTQKVVPMLQRFQGFRDEMTMISADGNEAVGISFWDREEDAEAYARTGYADVRKALEPFMTVPPEVRKYKLATSTVHAAAGTVHF